MADAERKYSCVCQGCSGYLITTSSRCYFSSALFQIEFEWSNITAVQLDTKHIKGVPTSLLIIKLERPVAPAFFDDSRRNAVSKKYFLHSFQDLLGVEERVRTMWQDHASGAAAPPNHADGVLTVAVPNLSIAIPASSPASPILPAAGQRSDSDTHGVRLQRPAHMSPEAARKQSRLRHNGRIPLSKNTAVVGAARRAGCCACNFLISLGPYSLTLVMLVGLISLALGWVTWSMSSTDIKTPVATQLLHQLREVAAERTITNAFGNQVEIPDNSLPVDAALWMARLADAAVEIAGAVVTEQIRMTSLRARRVQRESHERLSGGNQRMDATFPYAAPSIHTVLNSLTPTQAAPTVSLLSGLGSIVGEVKSIVSSCVSFVRYVLTGGAYRWRGSSKVEFAERQVSDKMVAYAEPFLTGQSIVQVVPAVEHEERRECLAITKELVSFSTLLDDIFLLFGNTLVAPALGRLQRGEERPHHWQPSPMQTVHSGKMVRDDFSSKEVLQLAHLRRLVQLLLHLNPLEVDEQHRRLHGLNALAALEEFAAVESAALLNGASSRRELERAFGRLVARQPVAGGAHDEGQQDGVFRNIVEEAKFWSRHEAVWIDHVFATLSENQQREVVQREHDRLSQTLINSTLRSLGDIDARMSNVSSRWVGVPIFRGMTCFSTHAPQIFTKSPQVNATDDATDVDGPHRVALQALKLAEQIKKRWSRDLRIFTRAALSSTPAARKPVWRWASLKLDEADIFAVKGSDHIRQHLASILRRANYLYLIPLMSEGSSTILRWLSVLWPPSWMNYFGRTSVSPSDIRALQRITGSDSSSQLLTTQVLGTFWADFEDAPQLIFKAALLHPPQFLRLEKKGEYLLWLGLSLLFAMPILLTAIYVLA